METETVGSLGDSFLSATYTFSPCGRKPLVQPRCSGGSKPRNAAKFYGFVYAVMDGGWRCSTRLGQSWKAMVFEFHQEMPISFHLGVSAEKSRWL